MVFNDTFFNECAMLCILQQNCGSIILVLVFH